jgi:hypothetical protein
MFYLGDENNIQYDVRESYKTWTYRNTQAFCENAIFTVYLSIFSKELSTINTFWKLPKYRTDIDSLDSPLIREYMHAQQLLLVFLL